MTLLSRMLNDELKLLRRPGKKDTWSERRVCLKHGVWRPREIVDPQRIPFPSQGSWVLFWGQWRGFQEILIMKQHNKGLQQARAWNKGVRDHVQWSINKQPKGFRWGSEPRLWQEKWWRNRTQKYLGVMIQRYGWWRKGRRLRML